MRAFRSTPSLLDEYTEDATVNLTPLIDVVFVILIMFIVVAPLLDIDRIQLAPAPIHQGHAPAEPLHSVIIHVYANDTIALGGQLVPLSLLQEQLVQAFHTQPDAHPQLLQDSRATFGMYQKVKNAVEQAGFSQLDVVLQP